MDEPIAEWFQPSNGRDGWQGLLPEIYDKLGDDQAELSFEFTGPQEFKEVFENCLRENGIAQNEEKISDGSIAEACYRDAQKAEHLGNESVALQKYEAAARSGYAKAQFKVGEYYFYGRGLKGERDQEQDRYRAVEYYEQAADQGHMEAQYRLGCCFRDGSGVAKDAEKAAKWFELAAKQGHAEAQCCIGLCYENGNGVENNMLATAGWYKAAAAQNWPRGMNNLATCYMNGEGVEQDKEKAVSYFQNAADRGDADAQYNLSQCYFLGDDVEKNTAIGFEWARKAGACTCAKFTRKLLSYRKWYGRKRRTCSRVVY